MKAPAFLVSAVAAARRVVAGAGSIASSLSSVAERGALAAKGSVGALWSRVGDKARKAIALVAVASLVAVAAMLLGVAIAGFGSRKAKAAAERLESASAGIKPATAYDFPSIPRSGPALAAMLLIPGDEELPYPLALEPKARYTEADAAPLRPDLGAVDVSDLIRRRKAELEAIYGAVD